MAQRKGFKHSKKTKKKMRDSHIGEKNNFFGKHHSKESKMKISRALKGHKGYWVGKKRPPFSKECKEKMSESRKGNKGSNWKGGKFKTDTGYIMIYLPNHPFCDHHGYIREHRLVIEQQIGRYLKPTEKVHHLGKKNDNSPQMLMAFVNNGIHIKFESGQSISPSNIIFDGRKLNVEAHSK